MLKTTNKFHLVSLLQFYGNFKPKDKKKTNLND